MVKEAQVDAFWVIKSRRGKGGIWGCEVERKWATKDLAVQVLGLYPGTIANFSLGETYLNMHFGWFIPILVLDIFICCISERLLLEAEAEILMEIYVKYPILQEKLSKC